MAQCVENKTPNGQKDGGNCWLAVRAEVMRLWKHLRHSRAAAVLGQFLYDMGFWGEYTALSLIHI